MLTQKPVAFQTREGRTKKKIKSRAMNILCDLGHKVHAEGNSPSCKGPGRNPMAAVH